MSVIYATYTGDLKAVRNAIRRGEDVNSKDKYGTTPLIMAAINGSADIARKLLSSGATVDLADKDGDTALIWAAREGYKDIVRELILSGATVDLANKNNGITALISAANWGRADIVRELLSAGSTVDLANKWGKTALDCARERLYPKSTVIDLLEAAAYDKPELPPQSAPVLPPKSLPQSALALSPKPLSALILPRNWTAVTDSETETVVYVNKAKAEDKVSTPPGYPLHQTSTHPDVTFCDEPQQKEFTSSGGHFDFNNGVEVTVSPDTIKAGSSVNIKVQPSLAPKHVFVMPKGIQSASPSYLLSSEGADVNGEVSVIMEHHVRVATKEEADDLLFLQADSSPKRSGSKCTYEYQEVPESRSEFIPGENKGRLTTKHFSRKFFKVGLRKKFKKWMSGRRPSGADDPPQTEEQQAPDSNLYTVRVYRSPPQTTGDRMAIICVSLFGKLYTKFLEKLDKDIIPRDYPSVSKEAKDRTILGSRVFTSMCVSLRITPVQGWSVLPDKEEIMKQEVDQLEAGNYDPEDLHDYPPRVVCTFYPEKNAPKRSCSTVYLTGLQPEVKVHIPLTAPKPPVVNTQQLEQATVSLKATVCGLQVIDSQLGSTVDSILSLIDRMTSALKSSSLGDLAVHTESIKREIKTALDVCKKIAEECTRQTIRDNIGVSLSKMEALSHQINQVTKVKLIMRHCQDQSEETTALEDLVESGADLLRTVDCLLKDMKTLSGFSSSLSITDMCDKYRLGTADISKEVSEDDILNIYPHLENWELVAINLGLTPTEREVIKYNAQERIENMRLYMLQKWRSVGISKEPSTATFRVLIETLLKCKCKYSADKVCKLLSQQLT